MFGWHFFIYCLFINGDSGHVDPEISHIDLEIQLITLEKNFIHAGKKYTALETKFIDAQQLRQSKQSSFLVFIWLAFFYYCLFINGDSGHVDPEISHIDLEARLITLEKNFIHAGIKYIAPETKFIDAQPIKKNQTIIPFWSLYGWHFFIYCLFINGDSGHVDPEISHIDLEIQLITLEKNFIHAGKKYIALEAKFIDTQPIKTNPKYHNDNHSCRAVRKDFAFSPAKLRTEVLPIEY